MSKETKIVGAASAAIIGLWLAWAAFMVWVIYTLVTWLVSK